MTDYYDTIDESLITRFDPNVVYVACTPPNYHSFYKVIEVVSDNSDGSNYVVTDKGTFTIANNYIYIRDMITYEMSYSEYFLDNKGSLVEARDTYEALGFDKPRTDDDSNRFLNAYGDFVELK